TEGAMEVIAQQVDDNWDDHEAHRTAAEIDHPDGSITNRKIRNGTITANKFVPGALTNDTQNGLRITALENEIDDRIYQRKKIKTLSSSTLSAVVAEITVDSAFGREWG